MPFYVQAESREKLVFTMPRRYHQSENSNLYSVFIMNRSSFKELAERHQEEFKKNILNLDKCGVFKNPRTKEQVPIQRFLTDEDAEAWMSLTSTPFFNKDANSARNGLSST